MKTERKVIYNPENEQQELCDYCNHKMDYESELNLSFEELEDDEIGENIHRFKNNNIRSD